MLGSVHCRGLIVPNFYEVLRKHHNLQTRCFVGMIFSRGGLRHTCL